MGIKLSTTGAYILNTDGYHLLHRRFIVICGFPGVGKSTLSEQKALVPKRVRESNQHAKWRLIDLESSDFPKDDFPSNYIERIKMLEAMVHERNHHMIVFCSSHIAVREALRLAGIEYVLAYPDKSLKEEYLERYLNRKNHPMPLKIVMDNFEKWIDELDLEQGFKLKLFSGQHLSDVITRSNWRKVTA